MVMAFGRGKEADKFGVRMVMAFCERHFGRGNEVDSRGRENGLIKLVSSPISFSLKLKRGSNALQSSQRV